MANLEMFVGLSLVADNFLRNIAKSSDSLKDFEKAAKATEQAAQLSKATQGIKEVNQTAKKSISTFGKLKNTIKSTFDPKEIKNFSKKLDDISEKFDDVALKAGTVGLGITGTFSKAITPAAEFEARMAEVSTLTDMSFEQFKKLYSSKLLGLSNKLGQDVNTVTKAFYDAISSGFSPEEALKVIEQAGKAAIGGVSDIATANNTLITVAKAWSKDGMSLAQISDYLFKTIAKGRTTFPELARNIGGVSSSIAAAGIKFKEFSAFVAAATAQGLDTNQTMTSLRAVVDSLVAPTGQAEKALGRLGLVINQQTLKQKGLFGTLKEIYDRMNELGLSEAEKAKYLATIFGSVEARKIVNLFMSKPEEFEKSVKQFQTVGGETEQAFQKMNQGALDAIQDLQNAFKNTAIVFGNLFLPVIGDIANKIGDFVIKLQEFINNHQEAAKWIGYVVGGLGIFASSVATSALALSFFLKTASFVTDIYGQILKPFAKIKDGIMNIISFTRDKWILLNKIFSNRKNILNRIDYKLLKIKYRFLDAYTSAKTFASTSFNKFINALKSIPSKINNIILSTYTWAKANLLTMTGLKNLSKTMLTNLLNGIKAAIFGFRALTVTMLTNPIFWIGVAFAAAALLIFKYWKPIANFFKGIWQGIKEGLKPIIPAVKETAKAFAPLTALFSPIAKLSKAIWNLIKPVNDTGNAALNMGIKFGQAIGKIIGLILEIPLFFMTLPMQLFQIGKSMASNIINGIKSIFSTIGNILSSAKTFIQQNWKNALKVFLWVNPITAPMMALKKLISFVSNINLFKAGQKIIGSIVDGMKNKFAEIGNVMKKIGQKIRNFLPFSPAKEGPLSDIHLTGIKLIQTIAQGIKEDPLVSKISNVLGKAKNLLQLSPIGLVAKNIMNIIAPKPIKPAISSTRKQSNITITVNPVINIQGNADKKTAELIAYKTSEEVEKAINKIIEEKMRLNYGL